MKLDAKSLRPLLILAAIIAYKWVKASGQSLGKRTVEALDYFNNTLDPIAKAVEAETGISARLGKIQAALESNYGASKLSSPDAQMTILPAGTTGPVNNLFGFKTGQAWLTAGRPYVNIETTDYDSKGQPFKSLQPFRAYGSWEESYRDWARLMQTPMYVTDGALAALQADDLTAFGTALAVHYAPNQDYDKRLADRAATMGIA